MIMIRLLNEEMIIIMSLHAEEMIRTLITQKANEKATLDYKVEEYGSRKRKDEVLKDTIAMLNSIEALKEDKYVILGVSDNKHLVGLKTDMRDDNEYQAIFDSINPRPSIETGTIEIEDKLVGYIYIKKENNEWPYEIGTDTDKYTSGTSFIRIGSTTSRMTQQQRDELTLKKYESNGIHHPLFQEIEKQNIIKDKVSYTDERNEGIARLNPSLNNGKYTLGKGLNEFVFKIEVPANDIARIYNDSGIKVARMKDDYKLWNELEKIDFKDLDFTNRIAECTYKDLVYVVNNKGGEMVWKVTQADSEYHGREKDYIIFEWKILT